MTELSLAPDTGGQTQPLFNEIRSLIDSARQRAAVAVNAELTLLYWQVGQAVRSQVLKEQRAEYGKQVIATLSKQLTTAYGKGWGKRQLHHCLRFAEAFQDIHIVHALRTQLSWTHLRALIALDDPLQREFYTQMATLENWAALKRNTKARWSCICAGWRNTNKKPTNSHPSVLCCAQAKRWNRSNYWS